MSSDDTRANEWFVPNFGPKSFRMFVGLIYLPYTGMCISFVIFGCLLAATVHWDRLAAIVTIYFLALGLSAHAADAMGSKKSKPWGTFFSRSQLKILIVVPLVVAYSIGLYYILFRTPLLGAIAVVEGFFLFAYNFELFTAVFHKDYWFSVAWGALPLLAGYIIQTGSVDINSVLAAAAATIVSFTEIRFSRPYKELRKKRVYDTTARVLERRLKILSISTVSGALIFLASRAIVT